MPRSIVRPPRPHLARQLGLFDATMLVMGGIVGSGIFINPYVVAQQVHTPALILGAWILGGIVGSGRRLHLGRIGGHAARSGRPVCLPARGLSPRRSISVRMGVVARHPDRRHGGCIDHLRALLSRAYRIALAGLGRGDGGTCYSDLHQLPRRKKRRSHARARSW